MAGRWRRLLLGTVPKHFADIRGDGFFSGMELVFLGTGAGSPSIERNASGLCMQLHGHNYLFDCGEGSLKQMFMTTIRAPTTDKIFITHLHGDHIFGLPGMLCTLNALSAGIIDRKTKLPVKKKIDVYGPPGLFAYVNMTLKLSAANLANIEIVVHELMEGKERKAGDRNNDVHECLKRQPIFPEKKKGNYVWKLFEDKEHCVKAGSLRHTVPCFGYVVEEHSRPGRIDAELAKARGLLPGPAYKDLKLGIAVPLPDGTMLQPHEVVDPQVKGRKVAILGDSSDSAAMVDLAMNSDVVVHESTLPHEMIDQAVTRGHSTSTMAGMFARQCNATLLVLNHFSHRFSYSRRSARSVQNLVDEARHTFRKRAVIDASDFLKIRIPRHDSNIYHVKNPVRD
ncbi:zinc phosphodiesterase ELAC protein 1-like [Thraustotheca clavata]|uniref:Zinc phosphodiesterase ELAC protein 1-like n=1 Tax=Thraustotheca clavata TaxID=74557 RepID=A0A1V9Y7V9_9STRA|nr:zinc phosphodiesterase ELAC protein 1-like [Thraustotheca clavata]